MRRDTIIAAVVLSLVALSACTPRARVAPMDDRFLRDDGGRPIGVWVDVTITCPNGGVSSVIRPWTVRVPTGGTVGWRLVGAAGVDSVTVEAKPGIHPWVLETVPPYTVKPATPAPPRRAVAAAGAQSAYGIRFTCRDEARMYTGVIDPDIIIIGGSTVDTTLY